MGSKIDMLTKDRKKEIIKELQEKAENSKAIVFANYSGLTVKDLAHLRGEMRQQGVEFKVARKTLMDLALKKAEIEGVQTNELDGQVGVAFSEGDEVVAAKILSNFAKKNKSLQLLGGVLEKKFIGFDQVMFLAKLPSKEELLAKLVGSLAAPMSGLLNVFSGNTRNLVYALKAISEKKA